MYLEQYFFPKQEQQITKEVIVDRRVHPRLIGQRGRQIRNIMADYKVDVRFCNESDPNPDMIVITGKLTRRSWIQASSYSFIYLSGVRNNMIHCLYSIRLT